MPIIESSVVKGFAEQADEDAIQYHKMTWQEHMELAIHGLLSTPEIAACISHEHLAETPTRVVKAYSEYFKGAYVNPAALLNTSFSEDESDEMIVVDHIDFTSFCGHHLMPFTGQVHFAYLPAGKIVGLSKIPRLIEALSARPQVQEKLAKDIVQVFMEVIQPHGCGVVIDAAHTCMSARGVRKNGRMRTIALRGVFKSASVKSEFFTHIKRG